MGILDRFRKRQAEELHNDWKLLNDINQLDLIEKESFEKPVVILKHSISCGLSAMAKFQLEKEWDFEAEELSFYYLDLINYRSISNEITDRFGINHQSPQLIILKNGKAVYNTSHHKISVQDLKQALE
jgi:monothiol bacilliredoxin